MDQQGVSKVIKGKLDFFPKHFQTLPGLCLTILHTWIGSNNNQSLNLLLLGGNFITRKACATLPPMAFYII